MTKIYLQIVVLLLVFSVEVNAQKGELKAGPIIQEERLYIRFIREIDNVFEFEMVNNTKDSLYLFDSYLFDKDKRIVGAYLDGRDMQRSKYLHRYDKKTRQCKLSFLPLIPYLGLTYTDRLILGGNKVAHAGQVVYSFSCIPPLSTFSVLICKDAIYQKTYVKEIYPKKPSFFKFNKDLYPICENIVIEFAVYKDIDLLTSINSYYFDGYNFSKQTLSYRIISVVVDL